MYCNFEGIGNIFVTDNLFLGTFLKFISIKGVLNIKMCVKIFTKIRNLCKNIL